MTKETLIRNYRKLSAADGYILGFVDKGNLYMTEILKSVPPRYIAKDKASKGMGDSIRLRLSRANKDQLIKKSICVGTAADLIDTKGHLNKRGQVAYWNKGDCFERMVACYYGLEWSKGTEAFTECGDVRVNGLEIQVKLDGATFVNETTLKRQRKLLTAA